MAKVYYKRIKKGLMTIEDVPRHWRDQVRAMLDSDKKE